MGLIAGIWLLVLGVLGASNLIISRKPDAKELIAKVAPYQGWIGAVSAVWGVWIVISAILNLGWLGGGFWSMIWWITYLADGVVQLALGLLLGVGVFKTFVKQPEAVQRMDELVAKLAPFQGTIGLVAIGLGVWVILVPLVFM